MADLLSSEEAIAEYFSQVLEDGDSDEILRALSHIARARGMATVAEKLGLARESPYKALSKALSPDAKPRCETILKVSRALGLHLGARTSTSAQ